MANMINTNLASLNAQNNLNKSQGALTTSLQRLSSGLRINSAKDDSAGMAIVQRMTSQISGNDQAARNANDAISMTQTAEGDLTTISDSLQRMRELAVQSSTSSNSVSDRMSIDNEVQALSEEIDRIAQNSSFNGNKLLDGSFTSQSIQIGSNSTANDTIAISIGSARTSMLGGVGSTNAATIAGGKTTNALEAGDLTLNGFQVGASAMGAAPGQSTSSAFSIAAAINAISSDSDVTATAESNEITGAVATSTAIAAGTFSINGIDVGAIAAGTTGAGQGANVAAAINKVATQTGVTAAADATTGKVTLTAADGRDINLALTGTATDPAAAATAKAGFLSSTGLIADKASAAVAGTTTTTTLASGTLTGASGTIAAGTISANGVSVGAVSWGTAASAAKGTTSASAGTLIGGNAAASGTTSTVLAAGTLSFQVNGTGAFVNVGAITLAANNTAAQNGTAIAAAINTALGSNGSAAADGNGAVTITAAASTTISLVAGGASADATTATADVKALSTLTGFSATQLGTKASGGAAGQASAITAALNTALAAAPGGASENGSVATGAILAGVGASTYTITKGSTNSVILSSLGTATNTAAAATNKSTLESVSTGFGLAAGSLGTQATATDTTTHGTVSLESTSTSGIVLGGASAASAGFKAGVTQTTVTSSINSISSINVLTATNASKALSAIDGALATVNASKASLGVYQNRFASVVSNLQSTSENLTASRSRIQDTDFAKETASLTRGQILQQAGTAMLAQANSLPNGVMALLR